MNKTTQWALVAALGTASAFGTAAASTVYAAVSVGDGSAAVQSAPEDGHHGDFGQKMFEKADTNHDGYLTKDEMMAAAKERVDHMFDKMDTNHDGKLSPDEIKAGREAMHQEMMQRWQAAHPGQALPAPMAK